MAYAQDSEGASMGYDLSVLLLLVLEVCFPFISGQSTCGQFSYHRHTALDDKTFSQDGLLVKVYTIEKAFTECSSDCFRDPSCNMFVIKTTTGECRMYKRSFFDSTHASLASGFRYYGAPCSTYKSSIQCQAGFSVYPGTGPADAHCYSAAGLWVSTSESISNVCKQDEWINTTEHSIPLPAPIVPGVTIDIRGSRQTDKEVFSALRQPGISKETILLRVMPDNDMIFGVYDGSSWLSSSTTPGFPIAPEVVFDLHVVVTHVNFEVKLNGNTLKSFDVGNPLNVSTFIQMLFWRTVERVKLTYP